ncbi:MAG: GntR family transcriptional regulator [Lachnospiraceae bacterium]|nr:GntR family transcriptional regulator [Lachnospiraceae bacterium]
MKILISNQSELPIYAQIREQLKEQILNGQLPSGTVLPSIRKLAKEVGVSVITTTRAYNDLEEEGFIASMQGKGSVVLSTENKILKEQYLMRIEDGLLTAVETAKRIHMTEPELHALITDLWKETLL